MAQSVSKQSSPSGYKYPTGAQSQLQNSGIGQQVQRMQGMLRASSQAQKAPPRATMPGNSPGLQQAQSRGQIAQPSTFKKGGKVEKTGYAKVHKGEEVLTKRQQMSKKM